MGEKITGYDGEVIAEIVDYHDSSGGYLGTAFAEKKGCLELILWLFLPIIIAMGMIMADEKHPIEWDSKYDPKENGCLELLLVLWLPIAIMMMEVTRG